MSMPGIPEILVIFLVVLLLFGAKRIPEIARGLGKGIREFKDATREITSEIALDDERPQHRVQQPRPPEQAPTPRQEARTEQQQPAEPQQAANPGSSETNQS
jgi:sec-independent protein translocase protein TatA